VVADFTLRLSLSLLREIAMAIHFRIEKRTQWTNPPAAAAGSTLPTYIYNYIDLYVRIQPSVCLSTYLHTTIYTLLSIHNDINESDILLDNSTICTYIHLWRYTDIYNDMPTPTDPPPTHSSQHGLQRTQPALRPHGTTTQRIL